MAQCEHFCYARNDMTILRVVSLSKKNHQEEAGDWQGSSSFSLSLSLTAVSQDSRATGTEKHVYDV